ncbi:MAG: hypothetical protein RL748_3721 [Pseudomonadota bacterium]|jgi:hypothetical protein
MNPFDTNNAPATAMSDAEVWQNYLEMREQFHLLMRHQDFINQRLRAITAILVPNQHFQEVDWSPQAVEQANLGYRPFTPGEKKDVL